MISLGHIFFVAPIFLSLLLPLSPAVRMNMASTMSRTAPSARQQNQVLAPQQAMVSCITSM